MTESEFRAVLDLHGWELLTIAVVNTDGNETCLARVISPIQADDVSQGPYRYEGMVRVVGEVAAPTWDLALQGIITAYLGGTLK